MRETETGTREQLRALGDVLSVMSRSPHELQPVLDAVIENAVRLCGATNGSIVLLEGPLLRSVAEAGEFRPGQREAIARMPVRRDRSSLSGRVLEQSRSVQIEDIDADPDYDQPTTVPFLSHTLLGVPMLREGAPIGVIVLRREEVAPFTPEQIALVEAFADQAVIAIENVRLFNETKEALERQTAIGEILRVIAGSPTDVQPVLETIARGAAQFCAAENASVVLARDGQLHPAASYGQLPAGVPDFPLDRQTVTGRAIVEGHVVHIHDLWAESDDEFPIGRQQALAMGHRTTLAAPLIREGRTIGAILLRRGEVRPFTAHQIDLVQTFADQAVIAIENVRLFNETKEALERQTAISDILRVISASPTDLGPVLDAVAESAVRFCGAEDASVMLLREDGYEAAAHYGPLETHIERYALDRGSVTGRAILELRTVHAEDVTHDDEFPLSKRYAEMDGQRTVLGTPLIREGKALGAIALRRGEPRPFTERQIELARTFADQAVIAIENVRLFNETKEALERQTAISAVLGTISRSAFDLRAILDTVVQNAVRLCGARGGLIFRRDGDVYRFAAVHGSTPSFARYFEEGKFPPITPGRDTLTGRVVVTKQPEHVLDLAEDPEYAYGEANRMEGTRTGLGVPLLHKGEPIGALSLWRNEVRAFSPGEIELVQTFADQAAIAIENVRLFNETKEALERQTAVAEVLSGMSGSAFELQPLLETVIEHATKLCDAQNGFIYRKDGDVFRLSVAYGITAEFKAFTDANPVNPMGRGTVTGRVVQDGAVVHVPDVLADPEYTFWDAQRLGNFRAILGVPMIRDGVVIGVMLLWRTEPRPFTGQQIGLVSTFADQATIAIENARLFQETTESLEQQTATAELLEVISSSTTDVTPVFRAVVENAVALCEADNASILRRDGDMFRYVAHAGAFPGLDRFMSYWGDFPLRAERGTLSGRVLLQGRTVQIEDIDTDAEYEHKAQKVPGSRTHLGVPLLQNGEAVGLIIARRSAVRPFADRHVRLLETFADQAVIAIENVRLFNEIQEKSRQLEIAGRHKSEFLANMSHELRTPLNAVIGFSEVLLQGMFGELNDKQREYQQDVLSSGRHLLTLINDILDLSKIEAGRVELELAEFSLPAALENGVTMIRERAARHGIRVEVDVDGVDRIVADERKVKQVIVNLLTNAVKFTRDGGRVDVRAERDNGEVRVAVRDTGIGIDVADRERIFEEFQQASRDPERSREGTGLGLALSKRYVELHGGRIWVESEVGRGSTFTFALPLVPAGKEG